MRVAVYVVAAFLGLLGLLFVVAAGQGNAIARVAIGLVCLIASGALVALSRLKPIHETHVHQSQLELGGDVRLENLTCRQCSATLSSESVRIEAGTVFVKCEFCGAEYQLEEAPKW